MRRCRLASRDRVTLRLEEAVERFPSPRVSITLAQAILKGDKMDDVVRDATMIGADEIVPVLSEHISVKPAVIARGKPEERWTRVAIASAKQCGRATVPTVGAPVTLGSWLGGLPKDETLRLILVEPTISDPRVRALREFINAPPPPRVAILVGPEGGWSHAEVEAALAGRLRAGHARTAHASRRRRGTRRPFGVDDDLGGMRGGYAPRVSTKAHQSSSSADSPIIKSGSNASATICRSSTLKPETISVPPGLTNRRSVSA